ncbi:AAA family ATPase [Microcoleus sp. FACHB-68]|uniref:AAA family ATPase n=1 Tax=Microcoleus sp. FACHB-68 TaxID=2692826 RepID=UPI001683863A|nr:AAA family ATPase [Microcoleus sp. FACHB-68]MBD1936335.1 AAA family ATPase [Microcoleus sp. FACHB-68]
MKLISITLCNFRQFYGKTPEILLECRDQRNTTIIHGNNGAGKTTLMNAFTWTLYEKFSAAFAAETQLVNKRAITEAEVGKAVVCSVEVIFEHDSKRYQAKRICRAYRNETGNVEQGESKLQMLVAGNEGRWMLPPQPADDIINRILPISLHQYFFFDGERIEQIVRSDKKEEIAEATKELLGIEVLNRAIRHLGEARKSLETDLRGIGDPQTQNLLRTKQRLEKEVERLQNRQAEIEGEVQNQGELKTTLSSRLLELGGAEDLQRLRTELETQKESLQQQLKQATEGLKKAISTRGFTVLLPDITAEYHAIVEGLRERGELPTGIKRPFVEELLHREQCICGAELKDGTHAHHLVQAWMDKAGVADVEETAIRLSEQVSEIDKQVPDFWEEVDRQQANVERYRTEISRIETQLDDTKKKLRDFPDEDVSQLQKRLDEIDKKISELNKETGSNEQQLNSLKLEIKELAKQIEKQQMNESRQLLAQRRIAATQDAMDRLTEVKTRLEQQFRLQLEKRVREIFSSISFTPYIPKLTEKYALKLVENTAGEEADVAASTGENQILSLSFIGGIIDRVREWSKKNTLMGPDSSTFPIVMDSPFGSLDEISRRRVASSIPKLANQLIVLVTKTQWRGEVAEEMANCIGNEYVLSYNSPKPDCEEDAIELNGVRYPLVRQSPNEFEYTEILEVERKF